MPHQEQSPDGIPRKDQDRPSPDVGERGMARPAAGGELNFDDGTDMVHPRGKVTGAGRTWNEKNPSDAGELGAPGVGMSDRNGPSDPDAKRGR